MSSVFLGFVFIVLGAIASSQWTVPLRYITSRTKWQWIHVYLVYGPSVVVLATLSAIVVTRGMLFDIVAGIRLAVVFATLFFGFCWGIGVTMTGFVVPRLGVAMTLTLNPSMVLIFGTLLPAFVFEPQVFSTFQGALIITSMVIVIAALLCALRANILRDRATERVEVLETETRKPTLCAGCALISGCLTSMSNLGWRIGRDSIRESAFTVAQCPEHFAPIIAWTIAFWGAMIPIVLIPAVLLWRKNKVESLNKRNWIALNKFDDTDIPSIIGDTGTSSKRIMCLSRRNYLLILLMPILQLSGFALYGVGSALIGDLGTIAGWAVFQSTSVLTANLSGILLGDWHGAGIGAIRFMMISILLLLIAMALLAISVG